MSNRPYQFLNSRLINFLLSMVALMVFMLPQYAHSEPLHQNTAIVLEIQGAIGPGMYALQLLPVNYVGLALIFLGIAFIISELFITSYGIMGVGGVVAFLIGSIMLIDTTAIGFGIPLPLILFVTALTTTVIFLIARMAIRAQHSPEVTGREEILISNGKVVAIMGDRYQVRIKGEIWQAESTEPLQVGQSVKVLDMKGLILQVKPQTNH